MNDDLNKKYVVTIDANIFHSIGYNFDNTKIIELQKIQGRNIKIVLSDIVYHEMIKHFEKNKKIDEQIKQLSKLVDFANEYNIIPKELITIITKEINSCDCVDISRKQINDFCDKYNIEVIDTSKLIDMQVILDMYVNSIAPFEKNKDKSSEFQDAISLVGLEEWAKSNNCHIIAISGDKGWKAYAENSSNILKTYDDIPQCLENILILIENHTKEYLEGLKSNALEFICSNSSDFSYWVQNYIEQFSVSIIANSHYYYDSDDEYITYIDHKISNNEINIVDVKDSFFEIKLNIDVIFEANANFSFYVKDSIDKDYVFMGTSCEVIETKNDIDLLIRFHLSGNDIQNFELINTPKFSDIFEVDFDWVEPNWD